MDDVTYHVLEALCSTYLRRLHVDDFLCLIIVELIHDAFKVWGVFCPPWSRHCRGLGIQYPVLICPLRYRDVLWWL